MKKIMALDIGEKRIGVALSDSLHMLAHPLKTIQWKGKEDFISQIQALVQEHDVEILVVGIPFNMKGKKSRKTEQVLEIKALLEKNLSVSVVEQDERLTTRMAEQALQNVGKKSGRERHRIDQIAAVYILQMYLDRIKNQSRFS